jgi:hypothetical protein
MEVRGAYYRRPLKTVEDVSFLKFMFLEERCNNINLEMESQGC